MAQHELVSVGDEMARKLERLATRIELRGYDDGPEMRALADRWREAQEAVKTARLPGR